MQGNEKPAPSFPSFYTVLFILAWGSMMFHIADTFNWGSTISHIADLMGGPKRFVTILHAVCTVIMLTGIFAVLRSGINWFTDVLGAFLLSVTLLCFYTFFFDI
jgi:membrane-associated phospholipid phosphatase